MPREIPFPPVSWRGTIAGMDSSGDPREARRLAIVATNFTFFIGYLALTAAPGWKQAAGAILFGAGVLATAWCWYAAIRSLRTVKPPAANPDGPSESN